MSGGDMAAIVGVWCVCAVAVAFIFARIPREAAPPKAPTLRRLQPIPYADVCSPHPLTHATMWIPTDDLDEALSVIAGGDV